MRLTFRGPSKHGTRVVAACAPSRAPKPLDLPHKRFEKQKLPAHYPSAAVVTVLSTSVLTIKNHLL